MSNSRIAKRGRPYGRVIATLGVVLGGLAAPVGAQQARQPTPIDSVKAGTRIRATSNAGGETIEAFLRGTHLDTLIVAPCNRCDSLTTAIPFRSIVDLQGERRRVVPNRVAGDMFRGLLLGSVIGLGIPKLAGYLVPAFGAVGGGTGIVVGGIVGLTAHRDSHWISISLPASTR